MNPSPSCLKHQSQVVLFRVTEAFLLSTTAVVIVTASTNVIIIGAVINETYLQGARHCASCLMGALI